ncbi:MULTISPECIES: hypothetical protein [Streptomyces]|uniref:Uncharacterized protein n=1 Tax=Streptomyces griseoaurantiacus TaxID=68213 RepID=A0ABZ1V9D6_9ACTN|nr:MULTISPECIES: hypothetical protein [Streptomyces]MCF0086390.1 hypothetical protein [Streptomyces sp. MH192]MCF0099835.1 hypothetical protein [Streptomyces sp. MH191]WTI25750.1 hypothetical protein OHA67_05020 [Streptomyces jietaisiensis]
MTDRLPQACRALRVTRADLVDAVCELSGRPTPPRGAHPVRALYLRVLEVVATTAPGALQPGDISAAANVRSGVLDVQVPGPSEVAAQYIEQLVDDLGIGDLAQLAHHAALTWEEAAEGAATVLGFAGPDLEEPLCELGAHSLVDDIAERPPQHWGRLHTQAVRAALYLCLADLADALLDASESTPTPLRWRSGTEQGQESAEACISGVRRHVLVDRAAALPPREMPVWSRPDVAPVQFAWRWQLRPGASEPITHGCGTFPTPFAARHAAECAITAMAAGRCEL